MSRSLALLVLLSLFLASAAFAEELRVKVIDRDGKPVDGAKVVWSYDRDPRVAGQGGFTFSREDGAAVFYNVHPGTHYITVEKKGFLTVRVGAIVIEEALVPKTRVEKIAVVLNPVEEVKR